MLFTRNHPTQKLLQSVLVGKWIRQNLKLWLGKTITYLWTDLKISPTIFEKCWAKCAIRQVLYLYHVGFWQFK